MSVIFMDTAKVMSKGQVTIPKRIRELLNLENGDYVTFVVNKDKVEFKILVPLSKKKLENKIKGNKKYDSSGNKKINSKWWKDRRWI